MDDLCLGLAEPLPTHHRKIFVSNAITSGLDATIPGCAASEKTQVTPLLVKEEQVAPWNRMRS